MEGCVEDPAYVFSAPHGERVSFAGKGPPPNGGAPRLRLTLQRL